MSQPKLVKESEPTDLAWRRSIRDAINNVIKRLMNEGGERPTDPTTGTMFYDRTLGKPIWYHETGVWKDAAGTTV